MERLLFDAEKYQDYQLIALLNGGSEYAFQLLFDRYRGRIYRVGIEYLKSPALAQDVVQDVFMKLWFERENIKNNQPLEGWLFTVARNQIINQLKKVANHWKALQRKAGEEVEEIEPQVFQDLDKSYYQQVFQEVLNELSDTQRQVYQLVRVQRLSYAQAGEQLGISPLTIKTHMGRALRQIRISLQSKGISVFFLFF
ncbi:sigma-70 family RNA polymerase sigma factor [Flavihumibacter sp. RY-1]|uniref:Sigma-70 family RNA polymerase sigma factor n=1 Tax=Flavihumibacter fluminis TaxID=2909236 RepID=A0ABS9BDY5_9BACT|nr:sigma-70 family RNA polymerase sigma factor [Flavihumibacter fluminis]MCF1713716.1 sigma-70 family RNA polymerase sigma factor [Flavihumibacter fluminis]